MYGNENTFLVYDTLQVPSVTKPQIFLPVSVGNKYFGYVLCFGPNTESQNKLVQSTFIKCWKGTGTS